MNRELGPERASSKVPAEVVPPANRELHPAGADASRDADQRLDPAPINSSQRPNRNIGCDQRVRRLRFIGQRRSPLDTNLLARRRWTRPWHCRFLRAQK